MRDTDSQAKEHTKGVVVYGIDRAADELHFLDRPTARWFAAFHRACSIARTYREFKAIAPEGAWKGLVQQFKGFAPDEIEMPELDDPFDPSEVPGASEGDWMVAPAMANWLPTEIQERFGQHAGSPMSGEHTLVLDTERMQDIVAALALHGFECVRGDDLVNAALGLEPRSGWSAILQMPHRGSEER